MKVRDFIRDQFKKRLDAAGCLVVYDGERRYRECAAALASDACAFIDAGESIITGRELALTEWLKMAHPAKPKQQRQLVVYVRPAILEVIRQLCEPDPRRRGHRQDVERSQFNLERFISTFDLLATKAEHKLVN
jgi:hypothetical protein